MKHYDYKCSICGSEFESSETLHKVVCPICKSNYVKKIWKPVNIHFKGSGFYSTDNKKQ